MGYYVKNLESGKLEMYFDKSEYLALPQADKKEVKGYFLWSSFKTAWVSKAKGNGTYAEQIAKRLGLEYKGEEGERLTFAEQLEKQAERATERATRYENRAVKTAKESDSLWDSTRKRAEVIPFGQPILAGHHSERRDRNFRKRLNNNFRKALQIRDKASYYTEKAETARETAEKAELKNPGFVYRRIQEHEAIIRQLERDNRTKGEYYAATKEKLEFYQKRLNELGGLKFTQDILKESKATHIFYSRTWYPIKSINKKSVTILNWLDVANFTFNIGYDKVRAIKSDLDFIVKDRDGKEVKPTVKHK